MQHSLLGRSRFLFIAAVFVLSILSVFSFTRNAQARSFIIKGTKVFNEKVGSWNVVDITNLAGQTQYLGVTVKNPDPSVKLQMLNFNNGIVDLDSSLVLRKDSTGLDHGTIIISHPSRANSKFSTIIILYDGNPQSNDTITINVDDSQLPPDKQLISITPASPLRLQVVRGRMISIVLTVKNMTTNSMSVWLTEPWGSSAFSPLEAFFTLSGDPSSNEHSYTINYDARNPIMPDSALFIFTPSVTGAAGDSVLIVVSDSVNQIPYLSVEGKNFFGVVPGTQHCDNIVIGNATKTPVIITAMSITGTDASYFSLNPAPTLPVTIDQFSKLAVPFCYNAPNARGTYSTPRFSFTYHAVGTADYSPTLVMYGSTVACLGVTPDTMEFGSLIAGGNAEGEVIVTNTFNHAVTLTKESWNNSTSSKFFSLVGTTLPLTIASNESKTLKFRFNPSATTFGRCYGIYFLEFTGADDSNCTSMQLDLEGYSINVNDTSRIIYQLFPNVKSAMPIQSDQQTTTKDFIFYNNSSNNVKVISVSVKDGTHFAVVSPTTSELPITLQPNGMMKVTISFDANNNGFYSDELDIVTENGLTSQAFSLQAIRTNGTVAGVKEQKQVEPNIMLSPNPSHGTVAIAISDADIHSIDIYDMLGNLVASEKNANLWMWNGKNMNEEVAADGTYFIRASGVTTSGIPFVKTTKLLRR